MAARSGTEGAPALRCSRLPLSGYDPFVTRRRGPVPPSKTIGWRRRSWEVINSDIVAGRAPGPEPPAEWLPHLRRLVEASRSPVEGPSWWTPQIGRASCRERVEMWVGDVTVKNKRGELDRDRT